MSVKRGSFCFKICIFAFWGVFFENCDNKPPKGSGSSSSGKRTKPITHSLPVKYGTI